MNEQTIDRIIKKTVFSMEVEGYTIPNEEKETIKKVLKGELDFNATLDKYIQNARLSGYNSDV